MHRMPGLFTCLYVIFCLPLVVPANPQDGKKSDCKSLITHSGFAEFVMPAEGGTNKLTIQVGPSVKWEIRNSAYVDWIAILDGGSGTGPGTVVIKLEANPENSCRVGELTMAGIMRIYGVPIRILQKGTGTGNVEKQERQGKQESLFPYVIDLRPFPSDKPQSPNRSVFKKRP